MLRDEYSWQPKFLMLSMTIYLQAYMMSSSKEIVRLVDIGFLEGEYSIGWASRIPKFSIPKKNGKLNNKSCYQFHEAQLIVETSLISNSKDCGSRLDPFNGRFHLCFAVYIS
jgi:hypothetical protein